MQDLVSTMRTALPEGAVPGLWPAGGSDGSCKAAELNMLMILSSNKPPLESLHILIAAE